MTHQLLDRLLALRFRQAPGDARLGQLEQDVWRRIRAEAGEAALSWQEKMFMAIGIPQFQMASLAVAVMFGIAVSPVLTPSDSLPVRYALGMDVFAAQSHYLVANLIEKPE